MRGTSRRVASGSLALIADHPDDQVAAYQQLGQSYAETGETAGRGGHAASGHHEGAGQGDWHAAAEMEQVLASLS